jgi:hypothetical protein
MQFRAISRPIVALSGALAALLLCCSADDGQAVGESNEAQDGNLPGSLLGSPTGRGENSRCTIPGATRPCCGTGTQTCEGKEILAWGACSASCDAPPPATPPPSPSSKGDAGPPADGGPVNTGGGNVCKAGMDCKPGAIRYCDTSIAEWSKSTCDASGKWGACVAATAPSGPGCSQNSYSPEKCCPGLKLCCQDNPGGPFVDFGSGACAAVLCTK